MSWLFVRDIVAFEKGKRVQTTAEFPSVQARWELISIEMIAQSAAILLGHEHDFQKDLVFTKIDQATFEGQLSAGDKVEIEASADGLREEGAWFEGKLSSKSGAEVTVRFLLMNVGRLKPEQDRPITFNEEYMSKFEIRKKIKNANVLTTVE